MDKPVVSTDLALCCFSFARRRFRIWDFIDEGQPGSEHIIANYTNLIFTTLLHLKRSRSKLMESKRMASQREIDYLSATHGLAFNKDSSLCFELITWRRSSLWVLVLFGVVNMYFGVLSYIEAHNNFKYDTELATAAPLHRFPVPGYLSKGVQAYWDLHDPSDWTLYYGAIMFNYTKDDTLLLKRKYFMGVISDEANQNIDGVDDRFTAVPGGEVGILSREFSYGNSWHRFSWNINGTIRNAKGFCLEMAEDKRNTKLTVQDCAADFLGYETENILLQRQTWERGEQDKNGNYQIKSPGGMCVGVAVTQFCMNNDNQCIQWANRGDCKTDTSDLSDYQVTQVQLNCPLACNLCDETIDRDLSRKYTPKDNIPLTLVDCDNALSLDEASFGTPEAFYFELPNDESFQERVDWKCNDAGPSGTKTKVSVSDKVAIVCHDDGFTNQHTSIDVSQGIFAARLCSASTYKVAYSNLPLLSSQCSNIPDSHVNMDMTLVARFDLGHVLDLEKKGEGVAGLTDAPIDYLWRCYSTAALVELDDGSFGEYDYDKMLWNYCNRHDELKQELKGSLGIEPFDEYTKRMISVAFVRMRAVSSIVDEILMVMILLLNLVSVILSMVALQLYSRYKVRAP